MTRLRDTHTAVALGQYVPPAPFPPPPPPPPPPPAPDVPGPDPFHGADPYG